MNTKLSSKFAALALALAVNSTMIGGIAIFFHAQARAQTLALTEGSPGLGFTI